MLGPTVAIHRAPCKPPFSEAPAARLRFSQGELTVQVISRRPTVNPVPPMKNSAFVPKFLSLLAVVAALTWPGHSLPRKEMWRRRQPGDRHW